ncbi:Fic/DOC family protein [Metabacillus niabensis]|uniref:Fic/DOC family protein n=1 Tax=Metabacillus niabensis TaxID=324854 RepID=UPI00399F0C5A
MYDSDSKYEYPGTNVLINHFNIKDPQKLSLKEAGITLNRLFRLENSPIIGNFDLNHLKKIHEYVFSEIYPFARKLRDENIMKGSFRFAEFRYIESSANDLFKKLKSEKTLANLPKEELPERAAFYMSEINVLHPFREGNGRTTREFIINSDSSPTSRSEVSRWGMNR